MPAFMSEEWFKEVANLTSEHDGFEVPGPLKGLTINLNVTFDDASTKQAHMIEGKLGKGLASGAPVTINLPSHIAKKIFVDLDTGAGMQAFMSGQMRVDGDVSKLMVLQTAQPTAGMREYIEDVQQMTQ